MRKFCWINEVAGLTDYDCRPSTCASHQMYQFEALFTKLLVIHNSSACSWGLHCSSMHWPDLWTARSIVATWFFCVRLENLCWITRHNMCWPSMHQRECRSWPLKCRISICKVVRSICFELSLVGSRVCQIKKKPRLRKSDSIMKALSSVRLYTLHIYVWSCFAWPTVNATRWGW